MIAHCAFVAIARRAATGESQNQRLGRVFAALELADPKPLELSDPSLFELTEHF